MANEVARANRSGFNRWMHPRNPYCAPPDFALLSVLYPQLKNFISHESVSLKYTFDFSSSEAVRALTQALLHRDFGLNVFLPPDRLVPTLSLRLNYILWLEDILYLDNEREKSVRGIDIGCGASCIYPLLGAKKNKWKFLATESDEKSVEISRKNIEENKLQDLITRSVKSREKRFSKKNSFSLQSFFFSVVPVKDETRLNDIVKLDDCDVFDFCMCNPPFFSSLDEAEGKCKIPKPKRTSGDEQKIAGSLNEMVTEGGEVDFVKKIIEDSLILRNKIKYYTTMLGKKTSEKILKKELVKLNVPHWITTQFCQGKTMRWGLAWTFLSDVHLQQVPSMKKKAKPIKLTVPTCVEPYSLNNVERKVRAMLSDLGIEFVKQTSNQRKRKWKITAMENTWIHQRRQRRCQKQKFNTEITEKEEIRQCIDKKMTETSQVPSNSSAMVAELTLYKKSDFVFLELVFLTGHLGQNATYQLFQYFKNHLK